MFALRAFNGRQASAAHKTSDVEKIQNTLKNTTVTVQTAETHNKVKKKKNRKKVMKNLMNKATDKVVCIPRVCFFSTQYSGIKTQIRSTVEEEFGFSELLALRFHKKNTLIRRGGYMQRNLITVFRHVEFISA